MCRNVSWNTAKPGQKIPRLSCDKITVYFLLCYGPHAINKCTLTVSYNNKSYNILTCWDALDLLQTFDLCRTTCCLYSMLYNKSTANRSGGVWAVLTDWDDRLSSEPPVSDSRAFVLNAFANDICDTAISHQSVAQNFMISFRLNFRLYFISNFSKVSPAESIYVAIFILRYREHLHCVKLPQKLT